MNTQKLNRARGLRLGLLGCAALVMAAGTAQGQQNQDDTRQQDQRYQDQWQRQDQPQQGRGMQQNYVPQLSNLDFVFLSKQEGNNTVDLTIQNGRIVGANVNDRPVPLENVRVSGNTIRVSDENNQTTTQFRIPQNAGMARRYGQEQRFGTTEPYDRQPQGRGMQRDRMPDREAGGQGIGAALGFQGSHGEQAENVRFDQAIRVDRVFDNTPAGRAGLREGDLIVAIDGQQPVTRSTFQSAINQKEPGEPVRLTVIRNGSPRTITMQMDRNEMRRGMQQQGRVTGTTEPGYGESKPMLGIQISDASADELAKAAAVKPKYTHGIMVDRVQQGSAAERSGLREGDVIIAVDGRTPATTDLLDQRLGQKRSGDNLSLRVLRENGQERDINVRLGQGSGIYGTPERTDPYMDNYNRGRYDRGREEDITDEFLLNPNKLDTYRPGEEAPRTRPRR